MSAMHFLVIIHAASCFMMTGLIWTIQLVHYPSFYWIEKSAFTDFEVFHSRRISFIVIPVMIIELGSGVLLTLFSGYQSSWLLNLVGIIIIWLSTFVLSVPCHQKLSQNRDEATIKRLVQTNWPRTILWSVRSVFLFWILVTV